MKLSGGSISVLREYAARPFVRNVHPEDRLVYEQGLQDGITLISQQILEKLLPEEVQIPVSEVETENSGSE